MLSATAADYAKYLRESHFNVEIASVNESIDDMFMRLEELENMIAIVQEERGNAVGMTGSLSLILDHKTELNKLFQRIDALEQVVEHSKKSIDCLEVKVQAAEEKLGLTETSSKLLKMFTSSIFKKPSEEDNQNTEELKEFCVDDYFTKDESNN